MSFSRTAQYRDGHDFKQAEELIRAKALQSYGFAIEPTKDTQFGVCLALCITWIENKVESKSERVRGAASRMNWLSLGPSGAFKTSMAKQQGLADTAGEHGWDMAQALQHAKAAAPQPVYEVTPDGTGLNTDTVIVQTLPQHVPYVMVYRWSDQSGHAVVCYKTTNRTMIFDPNCGELACPHPQLPTMWAAYWQDVADAFNGAPVTYGLASVGVDPSAVPSVVAKPKKKCLLATAACESLGLPEDWIELELLRQFRDAELSGTQSGRAAIDRYYALAPAVIAVVRQSADPDGLLRHVHRRFVARGAAAVAVGDGEAAKRVLLQLLGDMAEVLARGPDAVWVEGVRNGSSRRS